MEKKMPALKSISGKLQDTEEKVTKQSVTKDGITKSITVKEVENGFIIEIREEGKEEANKEWYWATQTWISKTNPLEDEDKDGEVEMSESVSVTIAKALQNLKTQ
jgi:hypothetical protein